MIDVVLDRESLRRVELIFDRPLGDDRVGESLARDPASFAPRVGGVWSWVAANVLRFTPTSRLASATRYEISLHPERLLGPGQVLVGTDDLAFQTDAFQVERLDTREEPDPAGGGRVTLRGEIRFNHRVDPRELAQRLRLVDPARGEAPIAVTLETSYARPTLAWRSASIEKSREERELRLTIVSDLTSADGNVPLAADFTRTITLGSSERLSVRAVTAKSGEKQSTLSIELSSPVEAMTAEEYLSVEPPVDFRVADAANTLTLRGPFRPGQRYDLAIRAGLAARDGAALAEAFARTVDFAHLEPRAGFQSEGMFLAATGSRRVALETVNVDRLTLSVDRVYRNNILYLAQQRSYQVWRERGSRNIEHVFGSRVAERELRIEGTRNRTALTPVDLDELVDLEEPGFYRVGLRRPGSYGLVQRWILVTDLGLVVKRGGDDVLVWASSFADLAPLPGVQVRVVSDQNQTLAAGRTDASGLLHLRGLGAVFAKQRPAWVVAERGGDWSFLPLERSRVDTSGLDLGGAPGSAAGYDAFLYGERDLYRPGETARGVAVLRDRSLGTPPAMPAVLRHRNPEGQLRESWRVDFDAEGMAEWSHAIPDAARTGAHVLELVIAEEVVGRYRFLVEEFVPDRIRVGIEPPEAAVGPGAPLTYRVDAAYLFGPPAAGLPVETRVRLEPAPFAPEGHPGFVFANPERSFSAREILSREGALDETGRAAFEVTVPTGLEPPAALEAVVRARVRERGGRGVAAERRIPVHPHARYVGLRRPATGYAEPGQPVALEWVAVAPDGRETPTGPLRVELFRLEWQTVLRRTPSGSYRYHSERDARLVESRALDAGNARGRFELTPRRLRELPGRALRSRGRRLGGPRVLRERLGLRALGRREPRTHRARRREGRLRPRRARQRAGACALLGTAAAHHRARGRAAPRGPHAGGQHREDPDHAAGRLPPQRLRHRDAGEGSARPRAGRRGPRLRRAVAERRPAAPRAARRDRVAGGDPQRRRPRRDRAHPARRQGHPRRRRRGHPPARGPGDPGPLRPLLSQARARSDGPRHLLAPPPRAAGGGGRGRRRRACRRGARAAGAHRGHPPHRARGLLVGRARGRRQRTGDRLLRPARVPGRAAPDGRGAPGRRLRSQQRLRPRARPARAAAHLPALPGHGRSRGAARHRPQRHGAERTHRDLDRGQRPGRARRTRNRGRGHGRRLGADALLPRSKRAPRRAP